MKLLEIEIKPPTNGSPNWQIAGKTVGTEKGAALVGYRKGAEVMGDMIRDRILASDLQGVMDILKAAESKSFYGEPS